MEPALIDGRYQLLAELGAGGESTVFRARDVQTETEVAARLSLTPIPLDAGNSTDRQPLEHHEGWVRRLTVGRDPERGAYQVYELLAGQTLGQMIPSGPLDFPAWRRFVDQSLAAVEAVHLAGWVHGDLNADNFFLTASAWKLLELPFFRFAPPADRSAIFGSIYTISPEQFDGKKADVRSDLYALGCLYYYAASGEFPHPGENTRQVAIHCLRFEPAPLREKAPSLPAASSEWVMKLLSLKPEDRFPTATAARQLLGVA
jgi:eukaryotic-like serine/threonine-protein kinase